MQKNEVSIFKEINRLWKTLKKNKKNPLSYWEKVVFLHPRLKRKRVV